MAHHAATGLEKCGRLGACHAPGARPGGDWRPYAAFRLRAFAAGLRVFRAVVFRFAFVRERDYFTAFAISQSPSRVRIISNKKNMNQFDHFVDIEVDFARAIFLHSARSVARRPHFSSYSKRLPFIFDVAHEPVAVMAAESFAIDFPFATRGEA